MEIQQIAHRLAELCRENRFSQVHDELYSSDIVSLEPEHTPNFRAEGRAAIDEKNQWWETNMTVHGTTVSEPVIAGNFFSLSMIIDVTDGTNGQRYDMGEICVYEVREGKIVKEQFFY
jgi:ketosteroid isomerase-like protein